MTSYAELCREYGISYKLFCRRYYEYGWDLLESLETPKMSIKECCQKASSESARKRRFIGTDEQKLYSTLDRPYYQRVRRAVKKGIRCKDALRLCVKPFGAKDYGY